MPSNNEEGPDLKNPKFKIQSVSLKNQHLFIWFIWFIWLQWSKMPVVRYTRTGLAAGKSHQLRKKRWETSFAVFVTSFLWPFAMRHTCVRVKHARHQPNSRKRKKKKTPKHTHTHTTIRQMFDLDYVSPQVCACVRLVSTSWNNVSSEDHPSSTCSNHFWSRYRLQSNNRTHDITHTLFEMGIQNWKKQKLHHTCLFFFSFNKRIREWNPFLFLKAAALLLNFFVFVFFSYRFGLDCVHLQVVDAVGHVQKTTRRPELKGNSASKRRALRTSLKREEIRIGLEVKNDFFLFDLKTKNVSPLKKKNNRPHPPPPPNCWSETIARWGEKRRVGTCARTSQCIRVILFIYFFYTKMYF